MFANFVILLLAILFIVIRIDDDTSQVDDQRSSPKPSTHQRLIVISFDGFRYDYLSEELTPNMFHLATKDGVTGHMVSTFTTKTFPNHHSIATGCYQETHGIVNNVMYDEEIDEVFVHKMAEHQSNAWWDNQRSTPIYIANELYETSRASACSPWIGCHASYSRHRARHFRHYNRSADWYEQLDWTLERMKRREHPANLAMIYIPQPDIISHSKGPFDQATLAKVRLLDRFVGYVRQRIVSLGLETSTNLMLVSDHGIAEISPDRVIVLDSFLNCSWYDSYGTNPVTTVQPKPGFEQVVEKALYQQVSSGLPLRVYTKTTIPARYRYRDNRRIHTFIVVAEDGWSLYETFAEADANREKRGQHGYDNLHDSMRPLFAAVGPAFKQAYRHSVQFVNVDLYPLMLTLLGIPTGAFYHEGELAKVKDLLRN